MMVFLGLVAANQKEQSISFKEQENDIIQDKTINKIK